MVYSCSQTEAPTRVYKWTSIGRTLWEFSFNMARRVLLLEYS